MAPSQPRTVQDSICVSRFGAVVNDGKDDAPAIRKAIRYAIENRISKIIFEAGVYDIISLEEIGLTGQNYPGYLQVARGILGSEENDSDIDSLGNSHLHVAGASGLTLEGAVDADGNPATVILRRNPMEYVTASRSIIVFAGCDGITVRNLVFDNNPNHSTSGEVVEVGDWHVVVDIFEGLPRLDNMPCICANAWDLETGRLKEVPSLTYGTSPAEWRTVPGGEGRRMRIDGVNFTRHLDAGDGISWWIGHPGYQINFVLCRDVVVENVHVRNAAGFAINTFKCVNVYGDQVVFRPEAPQLPVGPRDAWKLAWCTGEVKMNNLHVEGVRWDGQNVHGPWLHVVERISDRTVLFVKERGAAPTPIVGSDIGFHECEEIVRGRIASWRTMPHVMTGSRRDNRIEITFEEVVPSFVTEGTLATAYCYNIDRYELTNSRFEKIAGAASIIKNENVLIDNCIYDNIKHPAVTLATETYEGTYPKHVTIRNSTFISSGWLKRCGVDGALGSGIGSHRPGPIRISDITIENNTFKRMPLGISLSDIRDVRILNNRFIDVETPWKVNEQTTRDIRIQGNRIE